MGAIQKDQSTEQLCKSILSLETLDEVYRYLEDVATVGEINALAQRLEVSRLLSEGGTYPQIARQTGVSTAMISRVRKSLENGTEGYKLVLGRLRDKSQV